MAIVNSLVNQIGREIGRDVYRSAKESLLSSAKPKAYGDVNQKLLSDIQLFRFSTYKKVNERNLRKLTEDVINDVNPRSFLMDDVYISLIDLLEKVDDQPELVEDLASHILKQFSYSREEHVSWLQEIKAAKKDEFEKKINEKEREREDLKSELEILRSRSKVVKFILTPFGLAAAYYRVGASKLGSVFGVAWSVFSWLILYTNNFNTVSFFCLFLIQGWLFIASFGIHTSSDIEKDLKKNEDEVKSLNTEKDRIISSLEKQEEILMKIKI